MGHKWGKLQHPGSHPPQTRRLPGTTRNGTWRSPGAWRAREGGFVVHAPWQVPLPPPCPSPGVSAKACLPAPHSSVRALPHSHAERTPHPIGESSGLLGWRQGALNSPAPSPTVSSAHLTFSPLQTPPYPLPTWHSHHSRPLATPPTPG